LRVRVIVFIATFNNISAIAWLSVLLVKETRVPGENHRPAGNKYYDPNPQTSFNKCRVSNHRNHVNGNIERKENHYTKTKIRVMQIT
jgi:hypothetical protein